jgi:ribosome-binding protein aMBF1 (putative translation factor)
MRKVGDMKVYSFEELLEEDYGKVGTPERDAFEHSVDEAVRAYRVGEAIKQAREAQNLTQAELGEKMGVQRSSLPFREWEEYYACFYDACVPCPWGTSSFGDERDR